jgi:UDP-N-acetylmuramoyl-tripeptide--D-alanyl-D-alanine ligase
VIALSLSELAAVVDGVRHDPTGVDAEVVVDAVATDSRRLPAGRALFVALPGEHADGHDFVAAAAAAGAVAVLAERPADDLDLPVVEVASTWTALLELGAEVRRRVDPTAVAVTGSVGKTTVKDLTAAAVAAGRRTHAASGSFNNELGVPLTLLGLTDDVEVLVAEIGARHVGDIAALAPTVAPDVAVVTAVAGVHLEVFGTIDDVARAKSELVGSLGPDGLAVLNVADPRVAAMAAQAPAVLRVGLDVPDADVHATDVVLDRLARPRATAVTPWGDVEVVLPVAGRHQLGNALLALAVAGHLGVDLEAAAAALATTRVSPGRGAVTDAGGVVVLDDAYNANPTSVAAALASLVAIERTGRSWAVLGEMAEIGDTADAEHRRIGALAVELGVDELVVVGAGAAALAEGARAAAGGAGTTTRVREAAGAADAAELVLADVATGDVVLVKASRVAALESVAAAVIAHVGQREDAAP